MDKNSWIGITIMAGLVIAMFFMFDRPSKEDLAARQHQHDSIQAVQQAYAEAQRLSDSITQAIQAAPEAEARVEETHPEEQFVTLQNEHLRVTLSTHGGVIQRAELLEYHAAGDTINPLCLFRAEESTFSFTVITANNRILQTNRMYFTPIAADSANTAIMRMTTEDPEAWMDFVYTLNEDYVVRLTLQPHHMDRVLAQNINELELQWRQLIPQQEQGRKFEEKYAQLQYMFVGGDMNNLSDTKNDNEREASPVKWIGYKDQFFSTVLVADEAFSSPEFKSTVKDKYSGYIKEYFTHTSVPFDLTGEKTTSMRFFMVPNHYNTLKAYDEGVEKAERLHLNKLVPLGWKIVSWINTILVIPMFDLFNSWGLHIGWVILLMTIVIKLIILPFVFVSYKSSAKMRALKPQIDALNEKYPADKMQERQQAVMQLYQQAGVNPMSGCLPMLFQFPVLMAMFWFLPTAIELRGKSLWWAHDLSTYDAVFHWGFDIPFIGNHLSLFCLLMTIVNIVYTHITMQSQATDPNMKFMKYMMYAMPLMFLFIFNDYAAGLSFYYLVSLFITILQTMIFRWTLNDKKMLEEIEKNKKKKAGKPKSGFMARLEEMQRQQQQLAREQAKASAKRR
jgi:YidC/Oxa1 family membrane protein insertase